MTTTTIKTQALEWRTKLARAGYFLAEQEALDLCIFLTERDQPLILEGPPGSGKTSLVYAVARVLDAPVIRLNCYKSISVDRVLYGWDRRLQEHRIDRAIRESGGEIPDDITSIIYDLSCMKPGLFVRAFRSQHPHTCVLINEVDKIPAEEEFEATVLEVIEEHFITVDESGETIRPCNNLPPHIFFTSNAGVVGSSTRESLSHPLLRRGTYIHLPEPDRERRYEIIRVTAPQLPTIVARQCALFLERAQHAGMQKPIANSEGLAWARSLQHFLPFSTLTPELVALTISKLAKSADDTLRLEDKLRSIFHHVAAEQSRWRPRVDALAA